MRVLRDPIEIKQGLMACADYRNCTDCPYDCEEEGCMRALNADALALIRQLEQQTAEQAARLIEVSKTLEQVTWERDAAVKDLAIACHDERCETCAHYKPDDYYGKKLCELNWGECEFKWRGVPQEAEHE